MRNAGDLHEDMRKAGFSVESCDTERNVKLLAGATKEQIAAAKAFAESYDFGAEKLQVSQMTDEEILWVRAQMKANHATR